MNTINATSTKPFFLFPGQGAQYPGMAVDLLDAGIPAVKRLFETASAAAGFDLEALLRGADADTLKRTDLSQPAVTLANLTAAAALAAKGWTPAGCAGFSLGEYAALAVAGVVTPEDCFALVTARGKAMQAAVDRLPGDPPGMAAVIGLEPERVEALVASWDDELYAANFNSPRQTVVSGTAQALAAARERFLAAGARRFVPLAVAGPFHSPLMAEAAAAFESALAGVAFRDPILPLYSNVSGERVPSGEEARRLALAQICAPVRWTREEKAIQNAGGFEMCLEVGPGKVLQGLWKDSGSLTPCVGWREV